MCGFAGRVGAPVASAGGDALARALDAVRHRGPDGTGVHRDGPVALAHARLAVIDRPHGAQPVATPDGRHVAVLNGEIWNHRELRDELVAAGAGISTRCDAEVIPHLYARHGAGMVGRLRGMFALAVADRATGEVLLARDPFGEKPLCWAAGGAEDGAWIAFASTADALLPLLDAEPAPDARALAEHLVLACVPAPRAAWRGVEKLEPGSWMRWRAGERETRRWWTPPVRAEPFAGGFRDACVALRTRLRAAVARRLESEVPLGVFLSGGLDSSAVVAEMAALGLRPRSFTAAFDDATLDESRFAAQVARRFGAEHTVLRPDLHVAEAFRGLVARFDEPFADASALAALALARAAREHVTVVLTGDGGDELFAGYDRHRAFAIGESVRATLGGGVARLAASAGRAAGRAAGSRRAADAAGFLGEPWESFVSRRVHFAPDEVASMLRPEIAGDVDAAAPLRRLAELRDASAPDGGAPWTPWVDARSYLPDDLLVKTDRATMAVALEARAPMLDPDLWGLVASLPRAWLLGRRRGKRLLRAAYRGVLPDEILGRAKRGFAVPLAAWLRGPLAPDVDRHLVAAGGALDALLRRDAVRAEVARFRAGGAAAAPRVWNLLVLAAWLESRGSAGAPGLRD